MQPIIVIELVVGEQFKKTFNLLKYDSHKAKKSFQ